MSNLQGYGLARQDLVQSVQGRWLVVCSPLKLPKDFTVVRKLTVLGTSHQIQGAENGRRNVADPSYSKLVQILISSEGIDFVFEEASGLGPTTAEKLATSLLGSGRYMDIDPPRERRSEYGLEPDSGSLIPIDPYTPAEVPDVAWWEIAEQHKKRENLWVQAIKAKAFTDGLVICGMLHTLSLAFRLESEGFYLKVAHYMPNHRLCTRLHLKDL